MGALIQNAAVPHRTHEASYRIPLAPPVGDVTNGVREGQHEYVTELTSPSAKG